MQTTLYDKSGQPVAYVDSLDQNTVYLWNGNPVCYIDDNSKLYGFNGRHLGWFENGILRDLQGCKVGFIQNTCPVLTKLEPLKSLKRLRPLKSIKQISRIKPIYKFSISEEFLLPFLNKGAK